MWPALIIGTAWLVRRVGARAEDASSGNARIWWSSAGRGGVVRGRAVDPHVAAVAFFSLPTRAWELAAGGLVALTSGQWRRLPPLPAAIAGWAGLALILLACTQFNADHPLSGYRRAVARAGHGAGDRRRLCHRRQGAGRVLCRPMRAIGRVSYSWYLWHWPVLLLMPALLGHPLGLPARLAARPVSGGLAVLTLHFIENPGDSPPPCAAPRWPVWSSPVPPPRPRRVLALLLNVVPIPVGHGSGRPAGQHLAVSPTTYRPSVRTTRRCGRRSRRCRPRSRHRPTSRPSRRTSTRRLPRRRPNKAACSSTAACASWREVGQPSARRATPPRRRRWPWSATRMPRCGTRRSSRSPSSGTGGWRRWPRRPAHCWTCTSSARILRREYTECEQWRGQIIARVQAEHPRLVVLGMSRRYGADFGFTSYDPAWIASLTRRAAAARHRRAGAGARA